MNKTHTVIFVCEHGAAKSVVAAAYFNKMARERKLAVQAIARGAHPDPELAQPALDGLQRDGLAFDRQKPIKLSRTEAAAAVYVVTFCPLPAGYNQATPVEQWDNIPPVSENYDEARRAILERMPQLFAKLHLAP